jgi:alpha/beta hydrolase family protein
MNENNVYVLIHSPLVGGLTWRLVADQMRQNGLNVIVPILVDLPDSEEPLWKQNAESVSEALAQIPKSTPITLVAHSGAGPLLPATRQYLPNPVNAYVFVDAGIPRDGSTRLDLMKSEDPEWAAQFQTELERGERFPNWTLEDLRDVIPDESLRKQMVAEIRPRRLSFFMEPIPVFSGWPDAPCVYIRFSAPYEKPAAQARQAGWPTYELEAGHFHMLVDPATVTEMILKAVNKLI